MMADALYSLLWYPTTRTFEATRFVERPLPASDALVLHRRHGPSLAMGAAYAEVGAALLPEGARWIGEHGVRLLWVPVLPSRCLAARDATGVVRITCRPAAAQDGELSHVIERLEVESAWACDEAFSAHPRATQIARRLDAAHELTVDVISRFAKHASAGRLSNDGGLA